MGLFFHYWPGFVVGLSWQAFPVICKIVKTEIPTKGIIKTPTNETIKIKHVTQNPKQWKEKKIVGLPLKKKDKTREREKKEKEGLGPIKKSHIFFLSN